MRGIINYYYDINIIDLVETDGSFSFFYKEKAYYFIKCEDTMEILKYKYDLYVEIKKETYFLMIGFLIIRIKYLQW